MYDRVQLRGWQRRETASAESVEACVPPSAFFAGARPLLEELVDDAVQVDLGHPYTESGQTLQGSFSAVSKPNFQ